MPQHSPDTDAAVDAIVPWLKSTAHLPTFRDTAAFGVVIPLATPALYTEPNAHGVEGRLRVIFLRPESRLRLEIWERRTDHDVNMRVIFEANDLGQESTPTYWDMGPSIRRSPGGAIVAEGFSQELVQAGQQLFLVRLDSHNFTTNTGDARNCQFEMLPVHRTFMTKNLARDPDAHGVINCSLTYDQTDNTPILGFDTHGWLNTKDLDANPGRLFVGVEGWRSVRPG